MALQTWLGHAACLVLSIAWEGGTAQLSVRIHLSPGTQPRRVDVIALVALQDLLGRWSVLPVLAVACCVWNKWKATQLEGKLEQAKLEEVCHRYVRRMRPSKKIESGGACHKEGDAPGVIGVCVVFFFVFLLSVSFAISPPVGCRIDWEQLFLARGLRLPACVRGPPRRLRVVDRVQSNERRGAFLTAHLFAPSSLLVVIIRERASLAPHLLTCLSFAGVEAVSKGTEGQKKIRGCRSCVA